MQRLVHHLHAFACEIELTEAAWQVAVDALTDGVDHEPPAAGIRSLV
jgi:hypothetical protein